MYKNMQKNNNTNTKILAINDGRAGHFNQILGVLNYLPFSYKEIKLKPSKIGKLPNELIIYNAIGISASNKKLVANMVKNKTFPQIVLSAGRKSFALARYIKKQAIKNSCNVIVCQFMYPGFKSKDADLVFVSNKKHLAKNQENIIYKTLVANNVNKATLQESSKNLQNLLQKQNLKEPFTSIMLGGNYKNKVAYSKQDAIKMAKNLAKIGKESTLLISTSRRTPKEFINTLQEECKKHVKSFYLYNFNENTLDFNPYYGFFNLASNIVITYDSVSMISEACSLGKSTPIWIYDDFVVKYERFCLYKELETKGYVTNFNKILSTLQSKQANIPNYTKQIAEEILQKYNKVFS